MHHIPNILTLVRIILIPVYIYFFLNGSYYIAGFVFLISTLTDFFDGYLARKFNLISKLGTILDPLADKLTIISILFVLIYLKIIPNFIAIILLSREIFIFVGSAIAYFLGLNVINPSRLGKVSIFLLYTAIVARLLNITYVDMVLFYIVIPLNIISGFDYIITALKEIRSP